MPRKKAVRYVKVLVIDAVRLNVTEEKWNPADLEQIHRWVGVVGLDHALSDPLPDGRRCCTWVDDLGLYTNKSHWICPKVYPHGPLVGNAVVFGADREGETIDVPFSLAEVMADIAFRVSHRLIDVQGRPN